MASKTGKPALVVVGSVRVRAIRGPHKSGDGRWYWRAERSQDGQRETVFTGWRTSAEVEKEIATLVASGDLDKPRSERSTTGGARALVSVRDLMETWIWHVQNERPDLAESTAPGYRVAAKRILKHLASHPLTQLDQRTLERFKATRLREGASNTVSFDFDVLRMAWNWAWERGYVASRYLPRIRINATPKSKHTPTLEEFKAVLTALEGPKWRYNAFTIQAATGARIGEVACLTWNDVSVREGTYWLRLDGKTGERVVPLFGPFAGDAQAILRDQGAADSPVLGVSSSTARCGHGRWLRKATERAEVTYFPPHGIRRMAGNLLRRSGVAGAVYEAIMGHSEAVARASYNDVVAWELLEAVRRVEVRKQGEVIYLPKTA